MTQYTGSENDSAVHPSTTVIPASLESILCTEELYRRPSRPPDYQKENRALVALAKELNDWPQTILQTLADTILEVSQADSAGISLLRKEEGAERFYWPAIAGVWKPYVGGGTPREFGPCGDVLDSNSPLLLRHIERRYTYFNPVTPPVEECLLVPFYVQDKAVGTIWVVAHDDRRKFDAEDLRILRSLGTFASSAYQTLVSLDTLKSQIAERKQIEDRERQMTVESLAATAKFRAVFEQSSVFAGIMSTDGIVIDANDTIYAADSESDARRHPGWLKGIRIGSLKDGKVTGFFPPHPTNAPEGAMGEGIALDAAGNIYTAEATVRGIFKYVKK